MYTVSKRAKEYKQPRGGFLKPSEFKKIKLESKNELYEVENISPGIVGTVVDYMTRYLNNLCAEKAFSISLSGAKMLNMENIAMDLLSQIDGLNEKSIIAACKLVGFDTVLRAGKITYRPIEEINPDQNTIFNIMEMIERTKQFTELYGPIVLDGITFLGGYTETVISGDADFMTEDTIWDFKVSKNPIKSFQTLQILMYYLMGCKAIKLNIEYDFKNKIKNLGIYNPRLNEVYIKCISEIDKSIIEQVENEVIGYTDKKGDPWLKNILNNMVKK